MNLEMMCAAMTETMKTKQAVSSALGSTWMPDASSTALNCVCAPSAPPPSLSLPDS